MLGHAALCPLGVGIAALLERLDVAKLQRIPSIVSSCARLVWELLLSWSGLMSPNYSVYCQMCHRPHTGIDSSVQKLTPQCRN